MTVKQHFNIAHYLPELAEQFPNKRATVMTCNRFGRRSYRHYTFAQLNTRCDAIAWELERQGIQAGQKVLLLVTASLDLFALVFALFKLKAIPVMIDPGMGMKGFFNCIKQVEPDAMIGLPITTILRWIQPKIFQNIKTKITWYDGKYIPHEEERDPETFLEKMVMFGKKYIFRPEPQDEPAEFFPVMPCEENETAAILFTSGSTGPAKGVVYTHKIFNSQVEILRNVYHITAEDIDLPCFPLFALFSVALGATVVVPPLNPAKPITVDPLKVIRTIQDQGITYSFGSPAIWQRITRYAEKHHITLPSLKRVLVAGAPVPAELHQRFYNSLLTEDAQIFTPYGATESLPVANMNGRDVLNETAELTYQGKGICVGVPLPTIELKIIKISDQPIANWDSSLVVPQGEIGEICVKGDVVTQEYYRLPEATAAAKIQDGDVRRHRIGDVGYIDEKGRLWFCGRKNHRVETTDKCFYSICCEAIANQHPKVKRSALSKRLTQNGDQPVMWLEMAPEAIPEEYDIICKEVANLLDKNTITQGIKEIRIHAGFPVDVRHNAKINREMLILK